MVAYNIWDVGEQFKSDVFYQIDTYSKLRFSLYVIGSSPIM